MVVFWFVCTFQIAFPISQALKSCDPKQLSMSFCCQYQISIGHRKIIIKDVNPLVHIVNTIFILYCLHEFVFELCDPKTHAVHKLVKTPWLGSNVRFDGSQESNKALTNNSTFLFSITCRSMTDVISPIMLRTENSKS